jgi:hypothetical protein
MKKVYAVLAAAAIAGTMVIWAPWASSAGSGSGSTYEPVLDPDNFSTTIDNPYFPLPVGRTLVYTGVKDGQSQTDRVTVTDQTKVVAEGITARVVTDVGHARRHSAGEDLRLVRAGQAGQRLVRG